MLKLFLRKWWMVLVQGIVLMILSIYIFTNPDEVVAGISVWFGILVLATGLLGLADWLVADRDEQESVSFLWCFVTTLFGLIILFNMLATIKVLTLLFGMWMLLTGLRLCQSGWSLKQNQSFGWVMLTTGVLSVVAAFIMIFNMASGAKGISTLLGLQVLLTGIVLVLFSFVKKIVVNKISDKITSLN